MFFRKCTVFQTNTTFSGCVLESGLLEASKGGIKRSPQEIVDNIYLLTLQHDITWYDCYLLL